MKNYIDMKKLIIAVISGLIIAGGVSPTAADEIIASGSWTPKSFTIEGEWKIVVRQLSEENKLVTQRFIIFDDKFKTRKGPDLKVFLSPYSVSAVNDKTVTPVAIEIGELKSHRGAQQYEIPADVDLTKFKSLLIHCKAFSHLWGGADITPPTD